MARRAAPRRPRPGWPRRARCRRGAPAECGRPRAVRVWVGAAGAVAVTVAGGAGGARRTLFLWPHRPPIPHWRPRVAAGRRSPSLARVAAAVGAGVLLYVSFPPRPFWWLALPALGACSACSSTAAGPRRASATGSCSAWVSCCRCSRGSARWSARCRGWRSWCSSRCSSGSAARAWRSSPGCPPPRCGRPRSGSRARRCGRACRGVGCRGDASGSGSPTVRCCHVAAHRRRAAAVVRHRAGRARARRGGAPRGGLVARRSDGEWHRDPTRGRRRDRGRRRRWGCGDRRVRRFAHGRR